MSPKIVPLTVLALLAASASSSAQTKIVVIQPGTNRLVSHADVAVFTTGGQAKCLHRGRTGLSGTGYRP